MFQGSSLTIWHLLKYIKPHQIWISVNTHTKKGRFRKNKEKKKGKEEEGWDLVKTCWVRWRGSLVGTLVKQRWADVWATQQSPLAPHMHRLASQSSLILFGRGVAFGLSGNWDCFEQNRSSRKAWLIIFISTLWPVMHFRVFKTYLKKEKQVLSAPLI